MASQVLTLRYIDGVFFHPNVAKIEYLVFLLVFFSYPFETLFVRYDISYVIRPVCNVKILWKKFFLNILPKKLACGEKRPLVNVSTSNYKFVFSSFLYI